MWFKCSQDFCECRIKSDTVASSIDGHCMHQLLSMEKASVVDTVINYEGIYRVEVDSGRAQVGAHSPEGTPHGAHSHGSQSHGSHGPQRTPKPRNAATMF